jgi:hypothetical protein
MYSLFLYIFAVHVSGAICTYPQEHKLQSTALGCVVCGRQRLYVGGPKNNENFFFKSYISLNISKI